MKLIFILLLVLVTSCASTLPPKEERRSEFILNTGMKKADAFRAMRNYLAKTQGDSKMAMQVNDESAAQLITHGNYTCNVFRQTGDFNNYSLSFTLDFQAKDNRARFVFEDVQIIDPQGQPVPWAYNQITSPEKLEGVKPCMKEVADTALKSMRKVSSDTW